MDAIWNLKNRRVTVMGLGHFGGGAGVVRFLLDRGARVTVTDLQSEAELRDTLETLDLTGVEKLHLGGHFEEDFLDADLIVVNPAVPPASRWLQFAEDTKIPLTTEINLFWQLNPAPILAVTGSNGKSTTTGLLHSICQAAGYRARLGGNIGHSLLPEVDDLQPDDLVVLELSSFQLNWLDRIFCSPDVAVVTNFQPNHLDWHESLEKYRYAKQTILRWQTQDSIAVLNLNDADVAHWPTHGRRCGFGRWSPGVADLDVYNDSEIKAVACDNLYCVQSSDRQYQLPLHHWLQPPGEHNRQNALAAACAAYAFGIEIEAIGAGIKQFQPLPHRLELVAEAEGRKFYNDSLATTPESAVCALQAFEQPVILIAGGYDKQQSLRQFSQAISKRTKAVALIGATAPILENELEQFPEFRQQIPCQRCRNLEEAFRWSVSQSRPGDVILLSPGCASYGLFQNYQDRGNQFRRLAQQWQGAVSAAGGLAAAPQSHPRLG